MEMEVCCQQEIMGFLLRIKNRTVWGSIAVGCALLMIEKFVGRDSCSRESSSSCESLFKNIRFFLSCMSLPLVQHILVIHID